MPSLGLGLGKRLMLKSFAQIVKEAGGVLYRDARKADGRIKLTGSNSPSVDLSDNDNNGTLSDFVDSDILWSEGEVLWSAAEIFWDGIDLTSGWQDGPPILRYNGIGNFVAFGDTASLDINTAPLTLGCTSYIPTGASDGWLKTKDNTNIQYGLFFNSSTVEIEFWLENVKRASVSIALDTWFNILFFWDGTDITPVVNNINQSTVGFIGILTSQPNNYSGKRTSGEYLEYDEATETIYIGSDLAKIKKAEARISAQYLALN